jgi:hypothetical protein
MNALEAGMDWQGNPRGKNDLESRLGAGNGGAIFRSQGERRIAAFLDRYGVRYEYEKPLALDDAGKMRVWYPDFHLPDLAAWIEFYGVTGSADYDAGVAHKNEVYQANHTDVIPVYPAHFQYDWQGHLARELENLQAYRSRSASRFRGQVERRNGAGSYASGPRPGGSRYGARRRSGYR